MAVTNKDVNALYLTLFNRMPEGNGQKFWLNNAKSMSLSEVASAILDSEPSKEYFKGKDSSSDFVEHIYKNLLGKDKSVDSAGIEYWAKLIDGGTSKSDVVVGLLDAAEKQVFKEPSAKQAQALYLNKLKMAEFVAQTVDDVASSGTIQEKVAPFTKMASDITADVTLMRALYETRSTAVKNDLVTPTPLSQKTSDTALEVFYDSKPGSYYQDLVNIFYLADDKKGFTSSDETIYIKTKLSEVGFNGVTGVSDPDAAANVALAGVNTANLDAGLGA